MNQHQFVRSCLSKYKVEPIPERQGWESAHYPVPKCLQGEKVVPLWSCDHTVQGLLQSEEFDYPCIHIGCRSKDLSNLEKYYPEHLDLYHRWYRKAQQNANSKIPKEVLQKVGEHLRDNGKGIFGMSEDAKRERNSKGGKTVGKQNVEQRRGAFGLSPEERSRISREASKKRWENASEEDRKNPTKQTPEQRSINAGNASRARWARVRQLSEMRARAMSDPQFPFFDDE